MFVSIIETNKNKCFERDRKKAENKTVARIHMCVLFSSLSLISPQVKNKTSLCPYFGFSSFLHDIQICLHA